MNIAQAVLDIPEAAPAFGIPDAWTWSPAPGLVFAGAVSADGKRLFRVNARDSFDEKLVGAVLRFAREHSSRLLTDRSPVLLLGDFHCEGWEFDTVVGVLPAVLSFHKREFPALAPVAHVVFPAFHAEFSGVETPDEALWRLKRMRITELGRGPSLYVKSRWDNTRTLSGTEGPDRGFVEFDYLLHEISLLENAPGSFVEFENRHAEVWTVIWNGEWVVSSSAGERHFALDELLVWVLEQIQR